jgi:hypothetical protein
LRHAANGGISICRGWPRGLYDAVDLLVVAGTAHHDTPAHPHQLIVDAERHRDAFGQVRSAVWQRL